MTFEVNYEFGLVCMFIWKFSILY